ncbi:uncharacterized protein LOC142230212 [Haematobia irritans]|uniref:uncharacterized protein LOC142230212 n=1 Tax=Haematobia irritans TaxID=7368 RepID=UPI003F50D41A
MNRKRCSIPQLIEVFQNCPAKTKDELKHIYELSGRNIFKDSQSLQFLKFFIAEYHSDSKTDQYIKLHDQFDELLKTSDLGNHLTVDDLYDFDGLPRPLEDTLENIITSDIDAHVKDQQLRDAIRTIQTTLRNDIVLTKEYKIFQHDLRKAITNGCLKLVYTLKAGVLLTHTHTLNWRVE